MNRNVPVQEAANAAYPNMFDDEMRELLAAAADNDNDKRRTEAIDQLQEMPLAVDKIATYHMADRIEWQVLLGTGGPAHRVLVTTDLDGEVQSAVYEYQDWFTPWTAAEDQDEDLVKEFAYVFYYGSE